MGVFLYKESRITVLCIAVSEEVLRIITPLICPLLTVYVWPLSQQYGFNLKYPSKACSPSKVCFPLITQGAQLSIEKALSSALSISYYSSFHELAYFLACVHRKTNVRLMLSFGGLFRQPPSDSLWIMHASQANCEKDQSSWSTEHIWTKK